MIFQYTSNKSSLCFLLPCILGLFAGSGAGGGVADSNEPLAFHEVCHLEGFAVQMAKGGVPPVSISPAQESGDLNRSEDRNQAKEKKEWGQRMLLELEQTRKGEKANPEMAADVLAFREWCLGACGGGNLLLATASEETVVSLLFRDLVSGGESSETIRQCLGQCTRGGATAEYWLETLVCEGRAVDQLAGCMDADADYLRLASLFNALWNMGSVGETCRATPAEDGNWMDQMDDFCPFQLMARRALLEKKEVVLEVCLTVRTVTGSIPREREDFLSAVEQHAPGILRFRERLTGRLSSLEAWKFWSLEVAFWSQNGKFHKSASQE